MIMYYKKDFTNELSNITVVLEVESSMTIILYYFYHTFHLLY